VELAAEKGQIRPNVRRISKISISAKIHHTFNSSHSGKQLEHRRNKVWLFAFICGDKFFSAYSGLPERASQCACGKFLMHRDNAAFLLFSQHNMAVFPANWNKKPSLPKIFTAISSEMTGNSGMNRNLERCQERIGVLLNGEFFEIKPGGFFQVAQGFFNRFPLTGCAGFRTFGDIEFFLSVNHCGKSFFTCSIPLFSTRIYHNTKQLECQSLNLIAPE
jgi:hypothetical protein